MFTENFNKILLTLSLNFKTNSNHLDNKYINIHSYPNWTEYAYYINANSSTVGKQNTNILNGYIVLGNGNTEPTENDYKLSGTVISLTNQTTEVVTQGWGKDDSMEILYKVTGTPTSDATISEIGLVKHFLSNDYSGSADVLLAREVLATPITITNGVAVELYFRLKFKLT